MGRGVVHAPSNILVSGEYYPTLPNISKQFFYVSQFSTVISSFYRLKNHAFFCFILHYFYTDFRKTFFSIYPLLSYFQHLAP